MIDTQVRWNVEDVTRKEREREMKEQTGERGG